MNGIAHALIFKSEQLELQLFTEMRLIYKRRLCTRKFSDIPQNRNQLRLQGIRNWHHRQP
jgi:hypothetical protein